MEDAQGGTELDSGVLDFQQLRHAPDYASGGEEWEGQCRQVQFVSMNAFQLAGSFTLLP